jgi:hypothetical protein
VLAPFFRVSSLGLPSHLRRPPPRPHQQKPPILQELRRLSLNRMSNELQRPTETKQSHSNPQQAVPHHRRHQHRKRHHDDRYTKRMRQPIQRVLMALRVLRNPTLPTPSTKHAEHTTPPDAPQAIGKRAAPSGFSSRFAVKPTSSTSQKTRSDRMQELSQA